MLWRACGAAVAVMIAAIALTLHAADQARSADNVVIHVSSRFADQRDRVQHSIDIAIADYTQWLGPPPSRLVVADDTSWRAIRAAMNIESHVAYDLARQWFAPQQESPVVNGIAWYLQGRVVEELFDHAYQQAGYSGEVVWFFGGHVGRALPLMRHGRWSTGTGRSAASLTWPDTRLRLPSSVTPEVIRTAMALASLERSLGWPALQGGLAEVWRQVESRAITIDTLSQVLSTSTGRHTAGVFEAYRRAAATDLSVVSVASERCDRPGCEKTVVSVAASHATATGEVPIEVEFSDGQRVRVPWDGAHAQAFTFESPTAWSAVLVDPDRVALLDANWLNNDRLAAPRANVPVVKWTARWLVWLQDAVLAYSSGV